MSLRRGNFFMVCDAKDCGEAVNLKTTDFEEAKENKQKYQREGWTHYSAGHRGFRDYCPAHDCDD